MPAVGEHLLAEIYADQVISDTVHESSLLRLDPDEKFELDEQDTMYFNSTSTSPQTITEIPTRACVDSLHDNNRKKRDLSSVYNDQDNEFDKIILTNLNSVTVNREPSSDNEPANKTYIDNSKEEGTVVRFNQTLQNYLKVSIGKDFNNLTKTNRIQITDTTVIKYLNTDGYLPQQWNIKSNDKNRIGKTQNFIKSTKISSPTDYMAATSLPPIGDSFKNLETSRSNSVIEHIFVCFEQRDFLQLSFFILYYNRYSTLSDVSLNSTGRFRIQIILEDNIWSTRYNIPRNDRYSNSSTDWTFVSLIFVEIYGIKFIYDQIDTPHADMCFTNITKTHAVY